MQKIQLPALLLLILRDALKNYMGFKDKEEYWIL